MEKENKNVGEFDFDLPEVEGPKAVKPRVHFADGSTCISCEA